MSYADPSELWKNDPLLTMSTAFEAALAGLPYKVLNFVRSWPADAPWSIEEKKDFDVVVRMGNTTSTGRYRARGVSLLDIAAASLEFDRASQPGYPSATSYNTFTEMVGGRERPRNGLTWTQERAEHWRDIVAAVALAPIQSDKNIAQELLLSTIRCSRWDVAAEDVLQQTASSGHIDGKTTNATLKILAEQGRHAILCSLLEQLPPENNPSSLVDLATTLQNTAHGGQDRYWKEAHAEAATLFLHHPMGDAPIGPEQQLALKPIDLMATRFGMPEMAIYALRNYLDSCQKSNRPWQEGFVTEALRIVDQTQGPNKTPWAVDSKSTAGIRNAKVLPLVGLAIEGACEPALMRLSENLRSMLDSAEFNVLWKPEKLRVASGERVIACTRLLVDLGLELNELRPHKTIGANEPSPNKSYAPLHYAALNTQPDRLATMVALMEMGADPLFKDHSGRPPEELLMTTLANQEDQDSWNAAARSWAAKRTALAAIEELGLAPRPGP